MRITDRVHIIFLAGILAIAAVLWRTLPDSPGPGSADPPRQYTLIKTGSGVIADFSHSSHAVHGIVDNTLRQYISGAREYPPIDGEKPAKDFEGSLRWYRRQIVIEYSTKQQLEAIEQAFRSGLQGTLAHHFNTRQEMIGGTSVVRIDIGLRDKIGAEDIAIVTDTVYLKQLKAADRSNGLAAPLGKMAVIIDDFGVSPDTVDSFLSVGKPITLAILPYRQFSNEIAAKALGTGYQVILHLPMEPFSSTEVQEKTSIKVSASEKEIQDAVESAAQALPGIVGVNNHQGSRATSDNRLMEKVLRVVRRHNLFFVDSKTTGQSVAMQISRRLGVKTVENELFIDNIPDAEQIKKQLRAAASMAVQTGKTVVIGHARPATAAALREVIPEIEIMGVEFVFVSQLVK